MKAVIYARYSSDNQREESIEGQIRECMEYANYNEITVVDTYIDRALSAKTDNRPEFQRMIKDSSRGAFDLVIVWKLDRFARNRYDSAHYKATLKKNRSKLYRQPKVYLPMQAVSSLKLCLRDMQNTTLPSFPKRLSED